MQALSSRVCLQYGRLPGPVSNMHSISVPNFSQLVLLGR